MKRENAFQRGMELFTGSKYAGVNTTPLIRPKQVPQEPGRASGVTTEPSSGP